ncbi:MAG: sigma-54-dependent Fis family transcriptional regulator [Myxococcales bacterium]|nr:sigma-54-dependent Fis family transcriptional regulator [Myxococcales bacterium]
MANIVVIDDEKNICRTIAMVMEGEGHQVQTAQDAASGLACLVDVVPDCVLLDVKLGADNGIELISQLRETAKYDVPIIMISGHAAIDDAVAATKLGAFYFLEKPLDRNRLLVSLRNALERVALMREAAALRNSVDGRFALLGKSAALDHVRRQIGRVAGTKTRVLITGESGTGKELIARAIHRQSAVAAGPFVKVNCAAIPAELIESELFGHERGAFTGAVARKRGLFEVAHGGTIFLDEIGDMAQSAQAKVLRVLQTGEFTRVGGEASVTTDARVLAATHQDLEAMVKQGTFREDLFFRLNVFPLHSPRLAERSDDIPLLVEAFIQEACEENGVALRSIDEAALALLQAHAWPGNIRELRNVVERMVIMADAVIRVEDVPAYLRAAPAVAAAAPNAEAQAYLRRYADRNLREFRDEIEAEFIRMRLADFEWNISKTAATLGIERTNLHKKLRALGISRDEHEGT